MAFNYTDIDPNQCIGNSKAHIDDAFRRIETELDALSNDIDFLNNAKGCDVIDASGTKTLQQSDFGRVIVATHDEGDLIIKLPPIAQLGNLNCFDISVIRSGAGGVKFELVSELSNQLRTTPTEDFLWLAFQNSIAGAFLRDNIWYLYGDLLPASA